ncbi:Protein of unknown function [Bacillus mycoides]|nr:Protein of unknown function [Bacillus mycoides]
MEKKRQQKTALLIHLIMLVQKSC